MQRPGPRSRLLNRDTRNNKLSSNLSMSSYVSSWNQVTDWSAFNPLSLTPALWLDASDTASITSVGGAVSQWNDKSGNNYHATQATASNQPTTGIDTCNGLNVIRFDGNDFLSSNVPTTTKPFSMVVVGRSTSIAADRVMIGGNITVIPTFRHIAGGLLDVTNIALAGIGTSTTGLNVTDYFVMSFTFSSIGEFQFFLNNQPNGGGINNQNFSNGVTQIGSASGPSQSWNGQIAEMLKFNRVLSMTDLNITHRYLQRKWALQF